MNDYLNYVINDMGLTEFKVEDARDFYIGRYEKEDPGNPDNIIKGILFLLWVIDATYNDKFEECLDKGFNILDYNKFENRRKEFIEKYDKWNIY